MLPTPKGENVVIITGAGGSGVLLSDACVDNRLSLMAMPPDLDAAFRKFIPPFGAAGNPVDITGGEPPKTYQNTIRLGLEDPRIHALILGYWHTIVTPPMVFAKLVVEVVEEMKAKGIEKPIVASLAGDVRSRRPPSICTSTASPPMRTRPRCPSPCSAPSTSGRAAPDWSEHWPPEGGPTSDRGRLLPGASVVGSASAGCIGRGSGFCRMHRSWVRLLPMHRSWVRLQPDAWPTPRAAPGLILR